jgi:hypothetical protein
MITNTFTSPVRRLSLLMQIAMNAFARLKPNPLYVIVAEAIQRGQLGDAPFNPYARLLSDDALYNKKRPGQWQIPPIGKPSLMQLAIDQQDPSAISALKKVGAKIPPTIICRGKKMTPEEYVGSIDAGYTPRTAALQIQMRCALIL